MMEMHAPKPCGVYEQMSLRVGSEIQEQASHATRWVIQGEWIQKYWDGSIARSIISGQAIEGAPSSELSKLGNGILTAMRSCNTCRAGTLPGPIDQGDCPVFKAISEAALQGGNYFLDSSPESEA